jgi:hypothetical protein
MSKQLIHQYYTKLERIIQYGGSRNETAIRSALYSLINDLFLAESPFSGLCALSTQNFLP